MAVFFPENGIVAHVSDVKEGVLLMNLGSPDSTENKAVRRYLAEFLSDRRVIEMNPFLWQPILRGIILPFRPKQSANLYRKIWKDSGSPLLVNTRMLAHELSKKIDLPVYFGMTYGKPAMSEVVQQMKKEGINRIIAIPLFPQYASSAAIASLDALWRTLLRLRVPPSINTVDPFYNFTSYIDAVAGRIRLHWQHGERGDVLLFSFHGIPLAQHNAGDAYVAQCYTTARRLAESLSLSDKDYRVVFQSRFGRAQWVTPSTQDVLAQLPKQGVQNVDICCPGFFCDCLETLEEISISGKEIFTQAGGKTYRYIPCLNAGNDSVFVLTKLVSQYRLKS
ncbi:MAG: ferrochelatase [Neisseriaceae bacterium]|nr:ferrochelatase [Neisseriaceae bacterium]